MYATCRVHSIPDIRGACQGQKRVAHLCRDAAAIGKLKFEAYELNAAAARARSKENKRGSLYLYQLLTLLRLAPAALQRGEGGL